MRSSTTVDQPLAEAKAEAASAGKKRAFFSRSPKSGAVDDQDFRAIPRKYIFLIMLPTFVIMSLFFISYTSFISMSLHESVEGKAMVSDQWSLESYRRFFSDTLYPSFLIETLYRSAQVTLFSLALGYPLAYCLARTSSRVVRHIIMLSMIIPLLSGGITIAYSWMVLLGNSGLINSGLRALGLINTPIRFLYNWLGVIISLVYFLLPFTALSLVGPLRNVPRIFEESAVNLGASRLQVFLKVVFPLTLPGIVEAISLTYALALSSFLFPMMLGGGKVKMMANIIYEAIFVYYDFPLSGMLATILLLVSIVTVTSLSFIQRSIRKPYE